jgi:hypothetical protein
VQRVGLGVECDFSLIRTPRGAATYTAKYLFKTLADTEFPRHWRRLRYSRSFPKPPAHESSDAFALVRRADWEKFAFFRETVYTENEFVYETCLANRCMNVVLIDNARVSVEN